MKVVRPDITEKLQRMAYLHPKTFDENADEELFAAYRTLQRELVPQLLPLMQLLCESGIVTAHCEDEEDRFVSFSPEGVFANGSIHILCREICASGTEMPQFKW